MSETQLHEYLRGTNSVQRFASLSRLVLLGLCGLMVVLALAVSFDAALSLPVWLRVVIDVLAVAAGIWLLVYMFRTLASFRFFGQRTARRVEESLLIGDNSFVNAVDLADSSAANVSQQLQQAAITKGNALSRDYSALSAVSFAPAMKAFLGAGLAVLAVAIFYFATPRIFHSVLPRFLDPFGNHPAYTSLEFNVTVNPTTVEVGQSATVFVDIKGPRLPEEANFVQASDFGELETPMLKTQQGEFYLELSDLTERVEFVIKTERAQSQPFTIEVLPVPIFEKVWVNYEFPEYTNWERQRKLLTSLGVRGLQRSKVTLEVQSNIPLQSGQLMLTDSLESGADPAPLTMSVSDSEKSRVSCTFELAKQKRFQMTLKGANGTSSSKDRSGKIFAVADRPPQISIIAPEPHVIAVEGWKVPIELQLSDDIGLNQLTFYRSINGMGPFPVVLKEDFEGKTHGKETYEFDLAELGAQSGDLITYYASISDNYPVSYPNSEDHLVLSSTGVIQVISLTDYQELAQRQYRMDDVMEEIRDIRDRLKELQEQRHQILDELEELQEAIESGRELTDEEKQRQQELQEQLEDFAEQTAELAEELKKRAEQTPIYDFEDALQQQLKELAQQLEKQSNDASKLEKAMGGDPAKMKDASQQFKKNKKPFDPKSEQKRQDMKQDLEKLAAAEQLLKQVGRFKNIVEQQREIADRMKEFEAKKDLNEEEQRRLKKLAKQQDLLQAELADTMEATKQAASEAMEKFPKASQSMLDIVEAIEKAGVLDDQQQAAESGQAKEGKAASEAAEAAAKKLEALQCDCNGNSMAQEMGGGDQPLSIPKNSMSKSMKQLAQSMQLPSMKVGKGGKGKAGVRGSISRATLFGPHSKTQSQSRRRGHSKNRQPGQPGSSSLAREGMVPEQLTPEARESQTTGPANMQGVPSAYTDHARAYLKRITEDVSLDQDEN